MKQVLKNFRTSKYLLYLGVGLLGVSLISNVILCQRCFNARPAIVKVDAELLVRKLVKNLAKDDRKPDEEELHKLTKEKLAKIDTLLIRLAAQEKFVILPSRAVIAGAVDITEQVELLLTETPDDQAAEQRRQLDEALGHRP